MRCPHRMVFQWHNFPPRYKTPQDAPSVKRTSYPHRYFNLNRVWCCYSNFHCCSSAVTQLVGLAAELVLLEACLPTHTVVPAEKQQGGPALAVRNDHDRWDGGPVRFFIVLICCFYSVRAWAWYEPSTLRLPQTWYGQCAGEKGKCLCQIWYESFTPSLLCWRT